ncbi:hypothetical protein ACMXYX_05980 [Neptuniibacter sp. QD72_48]|uniref:hypothetical protein n=1 Tax=unclassified Neptuniibacter TaxID=2630693 RepID=UPI0039F57BAB
MRKYLALTLVVLSVNSWAEINKDDLLKCRSYADPNQRAQCVQLLKSPKLRVGSSKCKKTLSCWEKRFREQAERHCSNAFTRRAKYSSYWASYWSGQNFDKVRWIDQGKGTMMYSEKSSSVVLQCRFYPSAPSRVRVSIAPAR